MENNLQRRWYSFCEMSSKKALSRLKRRNYKYSGIISQMSRLEQTVNSVLEAESSTPKQFSNIKQYINLMRKKEQYERLAIYSQGVCDTFSIVDKFR